MARNGPIGQAGSRAPLRRHPADDPNTMPTGQHAAHWPQHAPDQHGQPQQGYGHQPPFGQQHGHPQDQGQTYHFPQSVEPDPNYGYAPQAQPRAQSLPFSQFPAPSAPGYPGAQQQGDPNNYDLGSYMPASQQGYAQAEPAHYQHGHDPGQFGAAQQAYAEGDVEYDDGHGEEEEPRRGRRGMMIVAALVGAIGLGGAMAYGYKSLFASSGAQAPVVKAADVGSHKSRPEAPGGKEFGHTDKKLINRLGEDGRAVAPAADPAAADDRVGDDPNAPKRVKIIPITPGGQPPQVTTASAPPRPSGPPMVVVPGVMLDTGPQAPPSAARVPLPPPAKAAAAPPPPVRIASASPNTPPPQAARPVAPAREASAAAIVPKNPVPKAREVAPPVTATSGTSGFVAVLSSQKSRMDALKAFADLQQKYGQVLASRTPDVQEANLGDKGVWYRAVVGPPGSRDAATGLCTQLKTAGYSGCWVTGY